MGVSEQQGTEDSDDDDDDGLEMLMNQDWYGIITWGRARAGEKRGGSGSGSAQD